MNTGIYIRVSTEEQAKEGFSSIAQDEKLRAYAMLKDWNIYNDYIDEGISGKNIEERPAIKQLISDIISKKVNNVLVYKREPGREANGKRKRYTGAYQIH